MNQTSLEQDPATTLHLEGLALLRASKLKDGLAVLQQALALNPGSGDLHNDIATALWQTLQLDKAHEHFSKAIKLESKKPHIYNNYGYFLLSCGRAVEAERLLKKAIALKPDFAEAIANLAQCFQRLEKFDEAEKAYLQAMRMKPDVAETHFDIGTLYTIKGDNARAEVAFKKAIDLAPIHFRAWFEIARIHHSRGEMDQCLECLYKVKSLNHMYKPVWGQLINILNQRHQTEEAARLTQEALKLFPGDPPIILDYAANLRMQGRYQEALDVIAGINQMGREWPRTMTEKALNYAGLGQTDKAFRDFLESNALRKAKAPPIAPHLQMIKDLEALYTKEWIGSWQPIQIPKLVFKPVFVARFPGITNITLPPAYLDRQDIENTRGIPAIVNVVRYLSDALGSRYPAGIATLGNDEATKARYIYQESLRAGGLKLAENSLVVDTSPVNIIYAGIIQRLFPEAAFILMQGHPCDEVLGSFMEKPPLNDPALRAHDLHDVARLYGQSFRLWEHYRSVLATPLLETCKAPDTRLWKTYENHIKSIMPILQPWAEKYGYTVK